MTRDNDQEQWLRDLLAERTSIGPEEVEPLRRYVAQLPPRRGRRGRGMLAAAAGIVVMLGLAGLLVTQIPMGTSGAGPQAPDPAAFAGDPRLTVCNATSADASAIFEMAHLRDYPLHLPAAYALKGIHGDPDAPTLVIVLRGPGSVDRGGETPAPGTHDLCLVVGADAASWAQVSVVSVDTTGLVAFLPEPTGTPIVADLSPWADRCGGPSAGISAIVRLARGADDAASLGLDPEPAELATAPAATVVVYDTTHPFPPLGTPPPGAVSPEPRQPLAEGHHDLCVLVGSDPATAIRTIHEDVSVTIPASASASPSSSDSPSASAGALPAQLDPAECGRMSFALDRCLAVVEQARTQSSLAWSDITRVQLASPSSQVATTARIATVTFTLRDGSTMATVVSCVGPGGQYSLVCTDHPRILLIAPIGGYHDVPCGATPAGEPGSSCASPLPSIEPSAAAKAMPLSIPSRDIPITATGHLEILLGTATLPNGILSDARFSLADPFTRDFVVANGISLVVRSTDPTRPPFDNLYAHGWYPGTEDVQAFLVLDVTSFVPGATIQVRDLVVR